MSLWYEPEPRAYDPWTRGNCRWDEIINNMLHEVDRTKTKSRAMQSRASFQTIKVWIYDRSVDKNIRMGHMACLVYYDRQNWSPSTCLNPDISDFFRIDQPEPRMRHKPLVVNLRTFNDFWARSHGPVKHEPCTMNLWALNHEPMTRELEATVYVWRVRWEEERAEGGWQSRNE